MSNLYHTFNSNSSNNQANNIDFEKTLLEMKSIINSQCNDIDIVIIQQNEIVEHNHIFYPIVSLIQTKHTTICSVKAVDLLDIIMQDHNSFFSYLQTCQYFLIDDIQVIFNAYKTKINDTISILDWFVGTIKYFISLGGKVVITHSTEGLSKEYFSYILGSDKIREIRCEY